MPLERKAAGILQLPYTSMSKDEAIRWARLGLGSFLHVLGDEARELQKEAMEHAGVPIIFGIDAIHGHALNMDATVYPSQLSMASSFDPDMLERVGRATAEEVSADGLHWTFSPVFCLARDIRLGRVDETFGEDKYLSGELGAAMIRGYQGDDLSSDLSILACAKHFIGIGEAAGARDSYDAEITERRMRAELLPPFERAVEAGCRSFMTAYGSIDGEPCTSNAHLLRDILKDELGFDGFAVTDWDNVNYLVKMQYTAGDVKEASLLAIEGGNDMIMTTEEFYSSAIELVREGRLPERLIDEALYRILSAKYDLGLFEKPYKQAPSDRIGAPEHIELNRSVADECVVLLKNDSILPLKGKQKIAIIGNTADDIRCHYGDWTYFTHPSPNPDAAPRRPYVTLLEGLRDRAPSHGHTVSYERGYELYSDKAYIDKAVSAAKCADVIIFACGDLIDRIGETHDCATMELLPSQSAVFSALSELGKPIVTVLIASKPMCIPDIVKGSRAVLTAFNGGMFGGDSLAKAIYGELNPEGKLPISFPYHTGQQPTYYNTLPGWHADRYKDVPREPLFVFGDGLSYTEFSYTGAAFDEKTLTLSVNIKNTGDMAGTEITQVYFRDLVSSVITPVKQLIAFKRTKLQPGEEERIEFKLSERDLSLVNRECRRVTERGEFEIMVGGSSRDTSLTRIRFTL